MHSSSIFISAAIWCGYNLKMSHELIKRPDINYNHGINFNDDEFQLENTNLDWRLLRHDHFSVCDCNCYRYIYR